ncbi:MAG: hypothetical protein WDO73_10545 [Ignavibacteriota bacterium]
MTRRLVLLLPLAACLHADSAQEVRDLIASTAGALSAEKVALFLDSFDRAMPGFDKLRRDVEGLTSQADIGCSIEITGNDGDDKVRTLTLDWILTIDKKDDSPGTIRRQKTVTCQVKKVGKNWRIVSFEPLDLFVSPG